MRTLLALAVLVSLLVAPAPATAVARQPSSSPDRSGGREVDIRPKFKTGDQVRYEMSIDTTSTLKQGDETPDTRQDMSQTIGLTLHVVEASADGATVELVYDRLRVSMETDAFKTVFDSQSPAAKSPPATKPSNRPRPSSRTPNPQPAPARHDTDADTDELLAQIMRPMVGTRLTIKFDGSGNITGVTGGDALTGAGAIAGLMGGLGGGLAGLSGTPGLSIPTPAPGQAAGPMSWLISGPRQSGRVRVGESWTNDDSLGGTPVGGMKMVTRHTCRSLTGDGRNANLSFSGRADSASAGAPSSATGFSLREATYDGDYVWDVSRGQLASLTSTLNSGIDGKVTGFSMSLNSRTRMTVRRLN